MSYLRETPEGVHLLVQAQPGASRSGIAGPVEDRLKIRVAAPPVDGEANEELLRFLKKHLKAALPAGVKVESIELIRGHASKKKDVLIRGVPVAALRSALV